MTRIPTITRRRALGDVACLGLAAAIGLGAVTQAAAETTLERARQTGYIRVGFANEAPFGYATPDGS